MRLGAEVEQLDKLAQLIRDEGILMRTRAQSIGAVLAKTVWTGPDADRFRSRWQSSDHRALIGCAAAMEEVAANLVQQGREQRDASSVDGGAHDSAVGPGGSAATSSMAAPPASESLNTDAGMMSIPEDETVEPELLSRDPGQMSNAELLAERSELLERLSEPVDYGDREVDEARLRTLDRETVGRGLPRANQDSWRGRIYEDEHVALSPLSGRLVDLVEPRDLDRMEEGLRGKVEAGTATAEEAALLEAVDRAQIRQAEPVSQSTIGRFSRAEVLEASVHGRLPGDPVARANLVEAFRDRMGRPEFIEWAHTAQESGGLAAAEYVAQVKPVVVDLVEDLKAHRHDYSQQEVLGADGHIVTRLQQYREEKLSELNVITASPIDAIIYKATGSKELATMAGGLFKGTAKTMTLRDHFRSVRP